MANIQDEAPTFLRRREVERRIGLGRSTIYQGIADGTFPKPVRLGRRAVGWQLTDIERWIAARIAESRDPQGAA